MDGIYRYKNKNAEVQSIEQLFCWSIFIVKESHHQKPIYFQEQINILRKYHGKIDCLINWDAPKTDFKQLSLSHIFFTYM